MRQLTEDEKKSVFMKIAKYIGQNVMLLVDRTNPTYVFRFHRDRIYYMSEDVFKMAGSVPTKLLVSAGTFIGKFTKTRKFRLSVTAVDLLARYATYKVWLKPAGEQSFLYGNHVIKRHLGRITENIDTNMGVVIYSMSDMPLGFGAAALSTGQMRTADSEAVVVYRHADIGEYLRDEAELV